MQRRLLSLLLHRRRHQHRKLPSLALPSFRRIRSEQDADAASPHLKHRMGIAPFNEKKDSIQSTNQPTNQPTNPIDRSISKTRGDERKLCKVKVCMSISFVFILSFPVVCMYYSLRPSWVWTWTLWPCLFRCTYAYVLPLNSASLPTTYLL